MAVVIPFTPRSSSAAGLLRVDPFTDVTERVESRVGDLLPGAVARVVDGLLRRSVQGGEHGVERSERLGDLLVQSVDRRLQVPEEVIA